MTCFLWFSVFLDSFIWRCLLLGLNCWCVGFDVFADAVDVYVDVGVDVGVSTCVYDIVWRWCYFLVWALI